MSTAPTAGDHAHAHAFDGEPVQALPADEPRTPTWLPLLGLLLFVFAGVALLVTGDKPDENADKPAPSAAASPPPGTPTAQAANAQAPSRPAAAVPQAPRPSPALQASGSPAATGSAPLVRLSPEQIQALQKQIEEVKAKRIVPIKPPNTAPGK
jgi:hypothetical protein